MFLTLGTYAQNRDKGIYAITWTSRRAWSDLSSSSRYTIHRPNAPTSPETSVSRFSSCLNPQFSNMNFLFLIFFVVLSFLYITFLFIYLFISISSFCFCFCLSFIFNPQFSKMMNIFLIFFCCSYFFWITF